MLAPTQGCRHGQPLPSTSRSYLQTGWPRYGIKTVQTIVLNRYHGRPMLPPRENSAASSELPRLGSPVTSRTAPLPVTAAEAAAGPARERNRLASSRARSPTAFCCAAASHRLCAPTVAREAQLCSPKGLHFLAWSAGGAVLAGPPFPPFFTTPEGGSLLRTRVWHRPAPVRSSCPCPGLRALRTAHPEVYALPGQPQHVVTCPSPCVCWTWHSRCGVVIATLQL